MTTISTIAENFLTNGLLGQTLNSETPKLLYPDKQDIQFYIQQIGDRIDLCLAYKDTWFGTINIPENNISNAPPNYV